MVPRHRVTHPQYSDFTDLKNWNDTGVIILDEAPGLPTSPLAPANYLDQFAQPRSTTRSSSPSVTAPRYGKRRVGPADSDPATPADRPPLHDRDRPEAHEPDPPDERQRARPARRRRYLLRRLRRSGDARRLRRGATRATATRRTAGISTATSASTSRSCGTGCSTASPTSGAPRRCEAGCSRLLERVCHGEHDVVVPRLADDLDRDRQRAVRAVRHRDHR